MEAHDCHYGTPLHVACARQHYDCAKVLLNAGDIFWFGFEGLDFFSLKASSHA